MVLLRPPPPLLLSLELRVAGDAIRDGSTTMPSIDARNVAELFVYAEYLFFVALADFFASAGRSGLRR